MGYIRKLTDYEAVTPSLRMRSEEGAVRPEDLPAAAATTPAAAEAAVGNSDEPERAASAAAAAAVAADRRPSASVRERVVKGEKWLLKRGHAFSYIGLLLFTIVVYFRPYELFPSLSGLTTIAFWFALPTLIIFVPSQFAVEGNLTWRPQEVNLILLIMLAALLSVPLAIDPPLAWETFNDPFIKVVLIFIVMVNVVRTEWRLKGMLLVALASGCLLSVQAWNDYKAGLFAVEGYRIQGIIGGMFANPNEMALHLVTMLPLAAGMLFATRNVFMKLIYGACTILMVIGIVVTYSRGGFLGLVAAVGVLMWKLNRQHRVRGVVLMVVITVVFLGAAPGNYGGRVVTILNPSGEGSASQRKDILHRSVIVSLRHPAFGIGMNCFSYHSFHNLGTHNIFTQMSSELGMPALIMFIMFLVGPVKRLRQIERRSMGVSEEAQFYYLSIGIQASLIGFMVSSFFAAIGYLWYAYYLVGYAVCLRRLYEARTGVTVKATTIIEAPEHAADERSPSAGRVAEIGGVRQAVAT